MTNPHEQLSPQRLAKHPPTYPRGEVPKLSPFPDDWTKIDGIRFAGLMMGNALVVGVIERLREQSPIVQVVVY